MPIQVNIAVFEGTPLDYQKTRHTALQVQFNDGKTTPVVIHITGANRAYQVQARDNYIPGKSASYAKDVLVGWITIAITKVQLVSFVCQTPIDNMDFEFNCQTWVERALKRLADAGYIGQEENTNGVNGMVDATMEAMDEHLR